MGKQFCLRLVFIGLVLSPINTMYAALSMPLSNYALPANSVRAKLDSIYQTNKRDDAFPITRDTTWVDYNSWHWLVGQLTADDNTQFVVKAARYAPGLSISHDRTTFVHTPVQNISRITRGAHANKIIQDKHLDKVRVPKCWIYPLSGNDNDLQNPALTDRDVIIVEELIRKKSDVTKWCGFVKGEVQPEVLKLDQETFNQLATFARAGTFLDLNPKNLIIDEQGKLVVFDLEDTLANQDTQAENSNVLIRPIKRYKAKQQKKSGSLYAVGVTGIANTDEEVYRSGKRLLRESTCTSAIKKNAFEIATVVVILGCCAAFVYMKHYTKGGKIKMRISTCRASMKKMIKAHQGPLTDDAYREIARKAVAQIDANETRDSIVDAFATIAIAEQMKRDHKSPVRILGITYDSPKKAIKQSIAHISDRWRAIK